MSSNPYENEPGFEKAHQDHDKQNMKAYVQKIRHETLRISIIARLEEYLNINADGTLQPSPPPDQDTYDEGDNSLMDIESPAAFEPFKDLCKRRFLWYYHTYLASIEVERQKVAEGESFLRMPFEHSGNAMEGKFLYSELERRIKLVRERLDKEAEGWIAEGKILTLRESGVAANLQRQYEQAVEYYNGKGDSVTLDIQTVDNNPFLWRVIYFGRPMTNLDGGLFNIEIAFSPRFPEEQPRAKFLTPFYHFRVSKDGIACYTVAKSEDGRAHVDALVALVEEETPPYDPRTQINEEASKLYWGTPEQRREYNRKLRRSVQDSLDYA